MKASLALSSYTKRWMRAAWPFLALVPGMLLSAQSGPDIRVDVDLVTVSCSVTDRDGAPVRGLKREDFALRDEGEARDQRLLKPICH
jgi:hypothetical protein